MKKRNLKTGLATLIICIGFATVSNAQRGQKERPTFSQLVEKMDTNKVGKISESEVKGPLKDNFSVIDTDEDGFISEEEFNNAPKPKRKK